MLVPLDEHHLTIGHGVRIHSQAFVLEYSTLEDSCWIGPDVVVTNAKYRLGWSKPSS